MTLHYTLLLPPFQSIPQTPEGAALGCSRPTAGSGDGQTGSGQGGAETCIRGTQRSILWAAAGAWQQAGRSPGSCQSAEEREKQLGLWGRGLVAVPAARLGGVCAMGVQQGSGQSSCCSCRGREPIRDTSSCPASSAGAALEPVSLSRVKRPEDGAAGWHRTLPAPGHSPAPGAAQNCSLRPACILLKVTVTFWSFLSF